MVGSGLEAFVGGKGGRAVGALVVVDLGSVWAKAVT